jgi:hypothetical protein
VKWERFRVEHDDETGDYQVTALKGGYVMRADLRLDPDNRPVVTGLAAARHQRVAKRRRPLPLSIREMRRLPFPTFAEAARAAVVAIEGHRRGDRVSLADLNHAAASGQPKSRAKGSTTDRWVKLAKKYEQEVARGKANPSAALAEREGVDPATMRVWVHRMRRMGLLPPAAGD